VRTLYHQNVMVYGGVPPLAVAVNVSCVLLESHENALIVTDGVEFTVHRSRGLSRGRRTAARSDRGRHRVLLALVRVGVRVSVKVASSGPEPGTPSSAASGIVLGTAGGTQPIVVPVRTSMSSEQTPGVPLSSTRLTFSATILLLWT